MLQKAFFKMRRSYLEAPSNEKRPEGKDKEACAQKRDVRWEETDSEKDCGEGEQGDGEISLSPFLRNAVPQRQKMEESGNVCGGPPQDYREGRRREGKLEKVNPLEF